MFIFLRWCVPNLRSDLKDRVRREAYLTNEIIIRMELLRSKRAPLATGEDSTADLEMFLPPRGVVGKAGDEGSSTLRFRSSSAINGSPKPTLKDIVGVSLMKTSSQLTQSEDQTGDVTDGNIVV